MIESYESTRTKRFGKFEQKLSRMVPKKAIWPVLNPPSSAKRTMNSINILRPNRTVWLSSINRRYILRWMLKWFHKIGAVCVINYEFV